MTTCSWWLCRILTSALSMLKMHLNLIWRDPLSIGKQKNYYPKRGCAKFWKPILMSSSLKLCKFTKERRSRMLTLTSWMRESSSFKTWSSINLVTLTWIRSKVFSVYHRETPCGLVKLCKKTQSSWVVSI